MNDIVFESNINGEKFKLKFRQENVDIERKCDTEYHIAFTELMQKGILPRASLEKIMNDRGIWTVEQQEELEGKQRKLAELEIMLDDAKTHDEGVKLAAEMSELRAECLKLVEVKSVIFANSCESLAESIRRDAYIAYGLVYQDTNKPVFKNYNDFLSRSDEDVVNDARRTLLDQSIKSFQDSVNSLPELSYLSKVEKETSRQEAEKLAAQVEEEVAEATEVTKTVKKTTKKTAKKAAVRASKSS